LSQKTLSHSYYPSKQATKSRIKDKRNKNTAKIEKEKQAM
jgi:hypothetical protein